MLTQHGIKADTRTTTAKSVVEFGDSELQGGHPATRAGFLCPGNGMSSNGQSIREALGPAGCLVAGSPTRMVLPTLLERVGGEKSVYKGRHHD